MPIGSSDGKHYGDGFEATLAQYGYLPKAEKEQYSEDMPSGSEEGKRVAENLHIDRDHDVPLAAAALDSGDGRMYGIAVDRRAPKSHTIGKTQYDPSEFVYEHEEAEHKHMQKLLAQGWKPLDAYHEAHDKIAIPIERESVKAFAVRNGEDPEKFWDEHQQFWRDVTKAAQEQDPEKVHPHTYLEPYDDHLRKKMEAAKEPVSSNIEDKRALHTSSRAAVPGPYPHKVLRSIRNPSEDDYVDYANAINPSNLAKKLGIEHIDYDKEIHDSIMAMLKKAQEHQNKTKEAEKRAEEYQKKKH